MLILPSAAIALCAVWQMRLMAALAVPAEKPAVPAADPHHIAWADVSEASACQLEVGYALIALVDDRKGAPLLGRITGIRKPLSKELGFVVPPVKVTDDLSMPGNCERFSVAGVIFGGAGVYPNDLTAPA